MSINRSQGDAEHDPLRWAFKNNFLSGGSGVGCELVICVLADTCCTPSVCIGCLASVLQIFLANRRRRHCAGAMAPLCHRQQRLHRLAVVLAPRAVPDRLGDFQLTGCNRGCHLARPSNITAIAAPGACLHLGSPADRHYAVSLQHSSLARADGLVSTNC